MTSRITEVGLSADVRAQMGSIVYEQNPCKTCIHEDCSSCSNEMHEQAQVGACNGYYPDPDMEVF